MGGSKALAKGGLQKRVQERESGIWLYPKPPCHQGAPALGRLTFSCFPPLWLVSTDSWGPMYPLGKLDHVPRVRSLCLPSTVPSTHHPHSDVEEQYSRDTPKGLPL